MNNLHQTFQNENVYNQQQIQLNNLQQQQQQQSTSMPLQSISTNMNSTQQYQPQQLYTTTNNQQQLQHDQQQYKQNREWTANDLNNLINILSNNSNNNQQHYNNNNTQQFAGYNAEPITAQNSTHTATQNTRQRTTQSAVQNETLIGGFNTVPHPAQNYSPSMVSNATPFNGYNTAQNITPYAAQNESLDGGYNTVPQNAQNYSVSVAPNGTHFSGYITQSAAQNMASNITQSATQNGSLYGGYNAVPQNVQNYASSVVPNATQFIRYNTVLNTAQHSTPPTAQNESLDGGYNTVLQTAQNYSPSMVSNATPFNGYNTVSNIAHTAAQNTTQQSTLSAAQNGAQYDGYNAVSHTAQNNQQFAGHNAMSNTAPNIIQSASNNQQFAGHDAVSHTASNNQQFARHNAVSYTAPNNQQFAGHNAVSHTASNNQQFAGHNAMDSYIHSHEFEQCHLNAIVPQLIIFGYTRSNILQALKKNGNGTDINTIIDILEQHRNIEQYEAINYTLNSPKTTSLPPTQTQKQHTFKLNRKKFMLPHDNKKILPPPAPPSTPHNITYNQNIIPYFIEEKLDYIHYNTHPHHKHCKHCKLKLKVKRKKHRNALCYKPKSRLCSSNFLQLYNTFDSNKITRKSIRNCLTTKQLKGEFDDMNFDSDCIGKICVTLWTLPGELYKDINEALYMDKREKLILYLPIIRGINLILVSPTNTEMITYRGSKMTDKQFGRYKIGFIFRCPAIGATSTSKSKANKFKLKYMIKFIIPNNCWNAADISKYSHFPYEKEILLPSYTAFKVLAISKKKKQIMVKVLDNKTISTNVPSVFI